MLSPMLCLRPVKRHVREITTKAVLVFGQTGHGKSCTANAMLGAYLAEESARLESCTDSVEIYENHWYGNSGRLTVIDTPGILDSEGRDGKHISEIMELFKQLPTNKLCMVVIVIPLNESRAKSTYRDMIEMIELLVGEYALHHHTMFVTTMENLMNPADPARIALKKTEWRNWLQSIGLENVKMCSFLLSSPRSSLEPLRQFFERSNPFKPVTSTELLLQANPGISLSENMQNIAAFNALKTENENEIQRQLDELKKSEDQLEQLEKRSEQLEIQQRAINSRILEAQSTLGIPPREIQ